ncbi:helix-turn-helix domain-containing protein [Paenibacillus favisporus]|uniref:helix-turn-helix domain-containing protein n=1 Tax=Paenibacillus TaxID=44249 RepID=UPI0021B1BFB9|nr:MULTISPECIES: helix-turn-helix domain-containing protein [Paenibacillus]MEC0178576.1 helix-turn-helix domain-containing protein [Paenibacillus favisporus]
MSGFIRQPDVLEGNGAAIFGDHFEKDDTYRLHRPDGMRDWLLVYTLSGDGYFLTPSGKKGCGAGQLGLLRSGVPHEYGTVRGSCWNFLWIHYPGLPENAYLPEDDILIETLSEERVKDRIERAFRNVLQDSRDRSVLWKPLCENAIREVLLLLAQRTKKRFDPRIEQTLGILSSRMKEEIRVDLLAREVGLSPSRLAHLFKAETGRTIVQHVNQMRIRQAALLMKHSGRLAVEAAIEVGFGNYNHFADQFRKYYGVTPREYRNPSPSMDKGT